MKRDKNVNAFNIKSDEYADARPIYPEKLYQFLSKVSENHDKAWDCACGTGQVSKSLINTFTKVYATDLNESQILNSYKNTDIHYSVQSSEETGFENSEFDLVCVAQAMHWFDIKKYFNEVHRVLKPDGIFACWGYSFFTIDPIIDEIIKDTILDPIKPYWSKKNTILWNNYKEITFPFEKIPTPEIIMKENWTKSQLLKYIRTWSAYRRYSEENDKDIEISFLNNVRDFWPSYLKKEVIMDFTIYIGRK